MRGAPDFVCLECERTINNRWWNPRDKNRDLPPICSWCEGEYTRGIGEPKAGTPMDRRNAMRIIALSGMLTNAAALKQWDRKYGRP